MPTLWGAQACRVCSWLSPAQRLVLNCTGINTCKRLEHPGAHAPQGVKTGTLSLPQGAHTHCSPPSLWEPGLLHSDWCKKGSRGVAVVLMCKTAGPREQAVVLGSHHQPVARPALESAPDSRRHALPAFDCSPSLALRPDHLFANLEGKVPCMTADGSRSSRRTKWRPVRGREMLKLDMSSFSATNKRGGNKPRP